MIILFRTNYKFAQFSEWTSVFKPGKGTIAVWENVMGVRGDFLYQVKVTGRHNTPRRPISLAILISTVLQLFDLKTMPIAMM